MAAYYLRVELDNSNNAREQRQRGLWQSVIIPLYRCLFVSISYSLSPDLDWQPRIPLCSCALKHFTTAQQSRQMSPIKRFLSSCSAHPNALTLTIQRGRPSWQMREHSSVAAHIRRNNATELQRRNQKRQPGNGRDEVEGAVFLLFLNYVRTPSINYLINNYNLLLVKWQADSKFVQLIFMQFNTKLNSWQVMTAVINGLQGQHTYLGISTDIHLLAASGGTKNGARNPFHQNTK